jgi:hypothetical protein
VNAGSLLAGQNKEELADMGKIHVTNNNEIYLKKPYLYNKAEHGKIIDTLYTLNDCIVEFDSVNIKYIKEIAFVKTDESLPLRLVIVVYKEKRTKKNSLPLFVSSKRRIEIKSFISTLYIKHNYFLLND